MCKRYIITGAVVLYFLFCIMFAIGLGEFTLHPQRRSINQEKEFQALATRFDAALEDVSITLKDGIKLRGWLLHPRIGIGDAVMLLHGVGDNRQGMMGYAEIFLSHGYAVLMPDARGHGVSEGFASYGVKEKEDVRQWHAWLRDHAKPHRIFAMGESMGAAIVLQALPQVPFNAVITESPFANFRDMAYIRVGQFFGTGPWLGKIALRPAVESAFQYCLLKYAIALSSISPEKSISTSRVPILLIHGTSDKSIPVEQSDKLARSGSETIVYWRIPDAGHCGAISAAGDEFTRRVLEWYQLHR